MKMFFYFIIAVFCVFVAAVWYCKSPALSSSKFPEQNVVSFLESGVAASAVSNQKLKVVTWNIGYASGLLNNQGAVLSQEDIQKNLATLAETLQKLNPDIVFLQEVDFAGKRSHNINQFEYLAKALNMPYGAYAVLWNKTYVPFPYWPVAKHFGAVVSGQAVLSRLPLAQQRVKTHVMPPNHFWYNWFYLDRIMQRVQAIWNGVELTLYNVHNEAFHAQTRLRQARTLAQDVLAQGNNPQIIAGDFNDPTTEEGCVLQNADVANTFVAFANDSKLIGDSQAFAGEVKTFPSDAPRDKLDHVLSSQHFRLQNRQVLCTNASDHCLVYVELEKI